MLMQAQRLTAQVTTHIRQNDYWQWVLVVAVGLVLGVWAPVAAYLPANVALVGTLGILSLAALLVVSNLQTLFLLVIVIDLALNVDINLGYRTDLQNFHILAGWPVSITTISLVALVLLKLGEKRRFIPSALAPYELNWFRTGLPLLAYVGANVLSLLVADDLQLALMRIFMLLQIVILFVYLANNVNRWDVLKVIVLGMMGVLSVESLLIIVQRFTGFTMEFSLFGVYGTQTRPGGTLGHPNSAASFLMALLLPTIGVLFAQVPRLYRNVAAGSAFLGLAALLITQSRGGWAGFVVGLAFFMIMAWQHKWLKAGTVLKLGAIVGVVLAIGAPVLMARLFGDDAGAAESRVPLIELALRMVADHPVIGVGSNNFYYGMRDYLSTGALDFFAPVHSKYLLVWSETGTIGLVMFVWYLGATLYYGWQRGMREDRVLSPLALGFTAGLLGYATHMLVDTFEAPSSLRLLAFLAGMTTALAIWEHSSVAIPESEPAVDRSLRRPIRSALVQRTPLTRRKRMAEQQLLLAPASENSLRKVLNNIVSLLASDVVNRATTFIQYALVGRYLGTYEFGQMSVALAVFYPAQVLATAGLKTLVTREVAKDRTTTEKYLVNASAVVFITSIITILAVIGFVIFMGYSRDTAILVVLMAAGVLPYALAAVSEGIFQGWEQMRFIAYANMPANVVKVIGTAIVLWMGAGLTGLILLLVGTYATLALLDLFFMLRNIIRPRLRLDPDFMVSMLKRTSTFLGIDGVIAMTSSLNVLLLSSLVDEESAGLLSSANQLMVPVTLVYVSIVLSFFPMMCRRFDPSFVGLGKIAENLLELLLVIVIPAVVGLVFIADWALLLLYGEQDFLQAVTPLRIMVWNLILVSFTSVLGQVLIASGRERVTLRIVVVNSIVSLVFGLILISQYGLIGAAFAGVAVKTVDLIQHWVPVSKLLSGIPFVRLLWKPALASAVMALFLYAVRDYTNLLTVAMAGIIYAVTWLALALASTGSPRQLKNKYSYLWAE